MNAHAKIDPVAAIMPWECEAKQDMRRRLRLCRDLAANRATHTGCDEARSLFWSANQAASEHIYAPAPLDQLKDVRDACLRLFLVANAFERWEASR